MPRPDSEILLDACYNNIVNLAKQGSGFTEGVQNAITNLRNDESGRLIIQLTHSVALREMVKTGTAIQVGDFQAFSQALIARLEAVLTEEPPTSSV